jgi:orotate phosphoribosyltransferase
MIMNSQIRELAFNLAPDLDIAGKAGATVIGAAVLVDRSAGQAKFSVPVTSLLELSFPTYAADKLPPELATLPAVKPGS